MKILQLLEALEIPHAIFATNGGIGGSDNFIVTDKSFRKLLKPLDFIIHREGGSRYETNNIVRELSREEFAEFKAADSRYKIVSKDAGCIVYERTRRPLKKYLQDK